MTMDRNADRNEIAKRARIPDARAAPMGGLKVVSKFASKASKPPADLDWRTHPEFAERRKREAIAALRKPLEKRLVRTQLAVFGVVFLLWPIPIINPIKLMVVVFHELSHVLAAFLTGGVVFGIAIDPGGAGVTLGMGGNELIIYAAGYNGSLLIGAALYALCATWEPTEVWGVATALACFSLAFGWLSDFTVVFGYGTLALLLFGLTLDDEVKKFLLRLMATTSCLYPLIDVAGEWLSKSREGFMVRGEFVGSDVSVLARHLAMPEAAIAIPSVLVGLAATLLLIAWSARKEAGAEARRSLFRRNKNRLPGGMRLPDDESTIPEYTVR